jgi:hypothetical protein
MVATSVSMAEASASVEAASLSMGAASLLTHSMGALGMEANPRHLRAMSRVKIAWEMQHVHAELFLSLL